MNGPRYAELLRRWFQRARPETSPQLPADRRRLVGAVERALRARVRRRATLRWTATGGAIAAAAAAAFVLSPRLEQLRGAPAGGAVAGAVAVAVAGAVEPSALVAGRELAAPETSEFRLSAPDGMSLTLEPGSRLTVMDAGATRRLALARGAVRVHVNKLGIGQRFIIDSADSEVEVHGTTFRVAIARSDPRCPGSPETEVSVSEGVVTVTHDGGLTRLSPGDVWPAPCALSDGEPEPRAAPPSPARRSGIASRSRVSEPPLPPSALAAQNDLFAAAVSARRRGEPVEALRLFGTFIQRYPEGPLYEHALAQKMKLLGATDPWGAGAAAGEYLTRFPTGFARAEARALVGRAAKL